MGAGAPALQARPVERHALRDVIQCGTIRDEDYNYKARVSEHTNYSNYSNIGSEMMI